MYNLLKLEVEVKSLIERNPILSLRQSVRIAQIKKRGLKKHQ